MSVRLDNAIIRLEGECRVEDAEPLYAMLQDSVGRGVDLSAAGHLHAAVVQVLVVVQPEVEGTAADPFTAQWLLPLLNSAR
ncbi:MAG: hypothetical protein V4653_06650 [Pseudomonadota bacterium]